MKELLTIEGYKIAYRCYGEPSGFPVIMHHGLVGSCNLLKYWGVKAKKAGAFLIAIERPGYGDSDCRDDMPRIIDWAKIIQPLLEKYNCTEFGVIGISAGTPYAYSLDIHYKEKVKGIWILGGVPYMIDDEVFSFYPEDRKAAYSYYKTAPLRDIAERMKGYLDNVYNTHPEKSPIRQDVATTNEHGRMGIAREVKMLMNDWGFHPSEITTPVTLWHSEGDDIVPFEAAKRTSALIPNARFNTQQVQTHYPSQESISAMFNEIRDIFLT